MYLLVEDMAIGLKGKDLLERHSWIKIQNTERETHREGGSSVLHRIRDTILEVITEKKITLSDNSSNLLDEYH